MDRLNRLSVIKLSEIQITLCLVALYAEFDLTDEPFFEEESVGLAECAVSSEEPVATGRTSARFGFRLIWTVMKNRLKLIFGGVLCL